MSASSAHHRQRQYLDALGCGHAASAVLIASGGTCAPLDPLYSLYARKIAEAFDLPPQLILPIPEALPDEP